VIEREEVNSARKKRRACRSLERGGGGGSHHRVRELGSGRAKRDQIILKTKDRGV